LLVQRPAEFDDADACLDRRRSLLAIDRQYTVIVVELDQAAVGEAHASERMATANDLDSLAGRGGLLDDAELALLTSGTFDPFGRALLIAGPVLPVGAFLGAHAP
jgi:hypothetical protein